jgi:hypothetical protein
MAPPSPPSPAQPFDLPIVDPTLRALYRHWLHARGDRRMAARRAIDAMAIPEALPNLFVYTYDADANGGQGRFYCRLAGEQINAMVGTVCSRRFLDQIFQPQVVKVVHERYRAIVTRPTVLHMHGVVRMANGLKVPGERVVLPLGDDGVTGDALVGASVYDLGQPGQPTAPWVGEDFVSIAEPGLPPAGFALPG